MILPLAIVLPIWVASYAWQGGFVYELDGDECLVVNDGEVIRISELARSLVRASANIASRYGQTTGQAPNSLQILLANRTAGPAITTGARGGFGDAASRIVENCSQVRIPWLQWDVPNLGIRAYSLTFVLLIVGIVPFLLLAGRGVRDVKRSFWQAGNRCVNCGYARTGLMGKRCPECGSQFANQPQGNRLFLYVAPLSVLLIVFLVGIVAIAIRPNQPTSTPRGWGGQTPVLRIVPSTQAPFDWHDNRGDFPFPKSEWRDRFLRPDFPRSMPPDIIGPRLPHEMDFRRG